MPHLLDRVDDLLDEAPRPLLGDGERTLTQHELFAAAAAVAAGVPRAEGESTTRIAVALPPGVDATIAILGALTAGACYVPLDVSQPAARLSSMVDDACIAAAVGRGRQPDWISAGTPWIDLDAVPVGGVSWHLPDAVGDEDLAAILYTSGSTGAPKGIALSHRAMLAFADWAGETFAVGRGDTIAALAPPFFDLSVFDLFTTLRRGAAVEIVPRALTLSPIRLADWLSDRHITVWYTVPGMLGFLAERGGLAERRLSHLRQVLFAGEVMPPRVLASLLGALPDTRLANLFGPTETNVCCWWPVDRDRVLADPDAPLPIGGPAAGDELRIDPDTGELLVRGPTLMSGYVDGAGLHLPLDADGFYATGDAVRRDGRDGRDGDVLQFCGRLDQLLKIDGYRVEPAEVEAALAAHPAIRACVVSAAQTPDGAVLVAVYEADADVPPAALRTLLTARLPRPMIPRRFTRVDHLPRLPSGKVDRRA